MPVGILNLGQKVSAPSSTVDKLYNISGNLIWNGETLIHTNNVSNIIATGTISSGIWSSTIQLANNKITNNGGTKGISIEDTSGKVLINNTIQGDTYSSILTLCGDTSDDEGILFGKTHNTNNPKALYTTFANNAKSVKTQYCYTNDGAQYDFQLSTNNTLSNTTNKYFRIRQLTSTNTYSLGENSDYGFYLGSGAKEHTQSIYGYVNIMPQTQNEHSIWTGTYTDTKNYADYINIDNNHTCYLFMKQGLSNTYSGTEYASTSGWGLGLGRNDINNNFVIANWKSDNSNLHYGSGSNSWQTPALLINDSNKIGIGTENPLSKFHIKGTDAIIIPKGTTSEQPTGVEGMLRYNTTDSSFEGYNGTEWGPLGSGNGSSGSGNGGESPSPILEIIASKCIGEVITVPSGTYTMPNITTYQYINFTNVSDNVYIDVDASIISYKPPDRTSRVVYEFETNISAAGNVGSGTENDYLGDFKLYIDNTELNNANLVQGTYNNFGTIIRFKYIFEITTGTPDINNGIFSSWTTNKIIKLGAKVRSPNFTYNINAIRHPRTGYVVAFRRPTMSVTAIEDNPSSGSGGSGGSNFQPGDTIETLTSQCDGSSVTVRSGSYIFQNVLGNQLCNFENWNTAITGSIMEYKPPIGTTRVKYTFSFTICRDDSKPMINFALYIDNLRVDTSRTQCGNVNSYGQLAKMEFVINCNASSNDISKAHFQSWGNDKKILEVRARCYNDINYKARFHTYRWFGESGDGVSISPWPPATGEHYNTPTLTIIAIA